MRIGYSLLLATWLSVAITSSLAGQDEPASGTPAIKAKPMVTGSFVGNRQNAKLAFVSARAGEPFSDKPSIVLVFTEQDHSQDKKPDFKAGFGEYGSALILSVHEDGNVFGCQVAHKAHAKSGFSSSGSIRVMEFKIVPGRVEGHVTTNGEKEAFGETWSVDIKFVAPFERPVSAPPALGADSAKSPKPNASGKSTPSKTSTNTPLAAAANVHDLPFPEDVDQLEFKQVVQQIVFNSGSDVKSVAEHFSTGLAKQGWRSKGAELITPNSAILNLTRGDASLTVMVKPADGGSKTTIFARGLEWGKK